MMPRATFTKANLDRAAKVALQHGLALEVTRGGTIRLLPSEPQPKETTADEAEAQCDEIFGGSDPEV